MLFRSIAVAVVGLISSANAKTDLAGCTYYDTVVKPTNGDYSYASRIYYVPDTGEVCAFLDCGGGRAPPKTTVPGCPQYKGTATYSPSFINPKTLGQVAATTASGAMSSTAPMTTSAPADPSSEAAGTIAAEASKSTTPSSESSQSAQTSAESNSATGSSKATSSTASAAGALVTTGPAVGKFAVAALAAGMGLL